MTEISGMNCVFSIYLKQIKNTSDFRSYHKEESYQIYLICRQFIHTDKNASFGHWPLLREKSMQEYCTE